MDNEIIAVLLISLVIIIGVFIYTSYSVNKSGEYMWHEETYKNSTTEHPTPPTTNSTGG